MTQKTRTIIRQIREEVLWNRAPNVADLLPEGAETNADKYSYLTIPKGTKFIICIGNEQADALEHYEVELLHDAGAQLVESPSIKVLRKLDDEPL